MLRRAVGAGLLARLEAGGSGTAVSTSICALQQQLQQQAGFAKKAESVDGRLQRVLRMLEPQDVEQVEVSEEDYREGMRRCGAQGSAAAACLPPLPALAARRLLPVVDRRTYSH